MHAYARGQRDIWKEQFSGITLHSVQWKNKTYKAKRVYCHLHETIVSEGDPVLIMMKRLDGETSRESFLMQFCNKVTYDTFVFLSFNPHMNKSTWTFFFFARLQTGSMLHGS